MKGRLAIKLEKGNLKHEVDALGYLNLLVRPCLHHNFRLTRIGKPAWLRSISSTVVSSNVIKMYYFVQLSYIEVIEQISEFTAAVYLPTNSSQEITVNKQGKI